MSRAIGVGEARGQARGQVGQSRAREKIRRQARSRAQMSVLNSYFSRSELPLHSLVFLLPLMGAV